MYKLIDGKAVAQSVKDGVKREVALLKEKGIGVGLAVILAGDNEASKIYIKHKRAVCEQLGIDSYQYVFDDSVSQDELLRLIDKLNKDDKINGILCQLPLPESIDKNAVIAAIDPVKDVDGFNPANAGKMLTGTGDLIPCTPLGIIEMLKHYDIPMEGKRCVVIGRSDIVGKPTAVLALRENATVTVCHSKTKDLASVTKQADIIISATGVAKLIKADMVKTGCIVIDVGISRVDGKLCGDVDFENVSRKAEYISTVPGGVGPMTIAMLMKNTLKAAKLQNGIEV